jgi:hypothetical protein
MSSPTITEEIQKIIDLTTEKKIKWTASSLTSVPLYQWVRFVDKDKYYVSIQNNIDGYSFIILKEPVPTSSTKERILNINDMKEPQLTVLLKKLFEAAEFNAKNSGAELIERLISGL